MQPPLLLDHMWPPSCAGFGSPAGQWDEGTAKLQQSHRCKLRAAVARSPRRCRVRQGPLQRPWKRERGALAGTGTQLPALPSSPTRMSLGAKLPSRQPPPAQQGSGDVGRGAPEAPRAAGALLPQQLLLQVPLLLRAQVQILLLQVPDGRPAVPLEVRLVLCGAGGCQPRPPGWAGARTPPLHCRAASITATPSDPGQLCQASVPGISLRPQQRAQRCLPPGELLCNH